MSEEKEQSQDKQSALKQKLKEMGVMRDEGKSPGHNQNPLMRNKLPIMFVVLVVAILTWWWFNKDQSTSQPGVASTFTPPPYPAPNRPYGTVPPPSTHSPMHYPGNGNDLNVPEQHQQNPWGMPRTRAEDVYGPPPGWGGYAPPEYYAPAPPPQYYGNPYYYGGPERYYPKPYYGGYYAPPPPPGYAYPE